MTVNAAFFQALAEISDHALIHAAHELAKKKSLPDLLVLADHLATDGKNIGALKAATFMPLWNPVDEISDETSLAKAFAIACGEETPQTLALLTRVAQTGVDRQQLLNGLVFESTSASMLQIAADGAPKDVVAQAIERAINFGCTQATMHLARTSEETMFAFCLKAAAMKPHETNAPAAAFVTTMRDLDQVKAVGAFLDDADRMMAPLGDEARRAAAGMRMAFVVEWLRNTCQYNIQRDTVSLDALMGSHLKNPNGSAITERMNLFRGEISRMQSSTSCSSPWEVKSKDSHNEHQTFLEADFYAWAVKSHCAPLLALCKSVADAATNDRTAPGILLAMQPKDRRTKSAREEQLDRVPAKGTGFKETLLALIDAGHSVNSIPDEIAKGGSALHALARMLNKGDISDSLGFERLVALLEVGADPRIRSRGNTLAEETIAEDKRDRWIGVVNACGSRSAAHAALQELGLDSPSPQKKVSP